MKLKFKKQTYQTHAVEAVVECFAGQPFSSGFKYQIDPGRNAQAHLSDGLLEQSGFRNEAIAISKEQLRENIRAVQRRQNLPVSDVMVGDKKTGCNINLDIEMETGTGKTYCYIKSLFELNKRYGWSKFIRVLIQYNVKT